MHKLEVEVPSMGNPIQFRLDGKLVFKGEE